MVARKWGWWTEQKLDILSDYLAGFSNASRSAHCTVYLDLFAGQAENVSRERTQHIIHGSPKRALDVKPPLSVLRFFELPANAPRLEQSLRAEYPDRNFQVVAGDCNKTIDRALAELHQFRKAPTFAFLDQQSTEVEWPTLAKLSRHRQGRTKTELWLLCASGLLPRGLRVQQEIDGGVVARMNAMFDTNIWTDALEAKRDGLLTSQEFEAELTNLMRWRLENVLGYKKTRVFKVINTSGREIFDMIFATDHDVGDRIMDWVYKKAQRRQPHLRQQAKLSRRQTREEEDDGILGLFEVADFVPEPSPPTHGFEMWHTDIPPHPPYRLP
ncbi:three-Cys-motif partner protein TcmP [Actinomadura geliboluensis]|uniref:three-Cys-motif partner protein TcmP n=1 Tax=Actinomadura geliboluensis TaxID=882440 RepID=UPI0037121BD8